MIGHREAIVSDGSTKARKHIIAEKMLKDSERFQFTITNLRVACSVNDKTVCKVVAVTLDRKIAVVKTLRHRLYVFFSSSAWSRAIQARIPIDV